MSEAPEHSGSSIRLNVAGFDVIVDPSREELDGSISELFRIFGGLLRGIPVSRRAIVGIAGVPGSGKSTLAALLAYLSTRVSPACPATAVSIDGWHYRNEQLEHMPARGPNGEPVTMRQRKGSAESFDVPAIVSTLDRLRDAYVPMRLPAYDRRLHEPVDNVMIVPPGVRLILLEGNYVLVRDGAWRSVADALNLAIFIDEDLARAQRAVEMRHVAGGATRDQAARKFAANDRPNTQLALASRPHADAWLKLDPDYRIRDLTLAGPRALKARAAFGPLPGVRRGDPPA